MRWAWREPGGSSSSSSEAPALPVGTSVLSTAVVDPNPQREADGVPLQVEYRERLSAAGKLPSRPDRRERGSSDRELLAGRLVDRALRPLLAPGHLYDTQVWCQVLSADGSIDPEVVAINAASAALLLAGNVPFSHPIGAVRAAERGKHVLINPSVAAGAEPAVSLSLTFAGSMTKATAIEATAKQVSNAAFIKAMRHASTATGPLIRAQLALAAAAGGSSSSRTAEADALRAFDMLQSRVMRQQLLQGGCRVDGRQPQQLRPISCQAGPLSRCVHGSGLFSRGETQSLATATVGHDRDLGQVETLFSRAGSSSSRLYLHYAFPPFSVGELGKAGQPNRREIGHGNLARSSLLGLMPAEDDFPFSVRVTADTLSSSGSSSMAAVCAGSLALRAAGIEDHHGDMDFKVAGTAQGITAVQLDTKLPGVDLSLLAAALQPAAAARQQLLAAMAAAAGIYEAGLDPEQAPQAGGLQIMKELVPRLIGPQGSTLLDIEEACSASLIVDDTGAVTIYAPTQLQYEHAVAAVEEVEGRGLQAGHIYRVKVLRVVDFGAYVALPNGLPALLHISELSHSKIKEVREVVTEGDELDVLCKGRNAKGFVRLSHKDLLKNPEGGGSGLGAAEAAASAMAAAAAGSGGSRGGSSSSSGSGDRAGGSGLRKGGGHPRALTWQPPRQKQQQQQQQQDE
ncbi:hypothetical protein OEZ85_014265 [Tetradesmus obliquus]|uniref:polyribonucleotide nucleotidyltransferase n=1 Tax=Tetradesmus obliquus TaxID=3088 RepID=A0ABY8U7H1_TETOB|nr:hypothetical protein OEZ85_014265 [Tetradesmus obliquus]